MSEDGESSRSPDEESLDGGSHMVELIYYNVPGRTDRSRRGKAYRNRADGELRCFEAHDGVKYRPGDHVYVESGSNDPFIIGTVSQFKMNKRESLSVKVTRFFRPEEVPEMSISVILQERGELVEEEKPTDMHSRELFTSESAQSYPISSLRGKCEVTFVKDFRSTDGCDLVKCDSFFSCLAYNHESLRLAAVQGEIRVGGAFQAKLPPEATCNVGDESDRDELIYRPGQISEQTEQTYIKLARSFRMFAMMSGDQKQQSVEKNARVSDLLFDDSITTLHRCGYKYDEALKLMNANDKLLACDANFMTPDDAKKFIKGIRTYGKNFLKISRELLPLHSRDQLVAYYYLWKKTSDATKPKPLTRPRNPVASVKKAKNGNNKASRPASTEYNDYASASESDVEEGKGTHYACHHCYSSDSKDWHHAGRDGLLLCTDCRMFFKKYGQLRPVDRPSTVPPTLFKRSPSGTDPEEEGVRTRAGKNGRRRTPSMGDDRRSPSQAVSIHEFDMEKTTKHKNGKRKKSHVNGSAKKKKLEEKEPTPPPKDEEEESEMKPASTSTSESSKSESPVKEELMENGFHEQVKQEEEEMKPEAKELSVLAVEPSTSRGLDVIYVKDEDDDDLSEYYNPDEDNTWQPGEEEAFSTDNAIFVRGIVRAVGHRCSRTDLYFRDKPGGKWETSRKAIEEKKKQQAEAAAAAVNVAVSAAPTPMPMKKPELNGLTAAAPSLPPQLLDQNMTLAMMMAQMQAAAAQQQAVQQQQHLQMQMEQQAQIAKQQMEMQRQQQILLQREAAQRMMPQFMDQRMAMLQGVAPPQAMGGVDPRMMEQLMAQAHMAQVQQVQQQLQQMAAAQNAAAAAPPAMITPEMQLMLGQNPHMLQQMMQQSAAQHQMASMMAMHPAMAVGSDMMRRLQQEGHRSFPQ